MVNGETEKDNGVSNIELEKMICTTIRLQNPYVPPQKSDSPQNQASMSDLAGSNIEEMLNQVLKRVMSTDN